MCSKYCSCFFVKLIIKKKNQGRKILSKSTQDYFVSDWSLDITQINEPFGCQLHVEKLIFYLSIDISKITSATDYDICNVKVNPSCANPTKWLNTLKTILQQKNN